MRTVSLLGLAASLLNASYAPAAPSVAPPSVPVRAYVVPDGSLGEGCGASCLNGAAAKLRGRRGVQKITVEEGGVTLEIQPKSFKAAEIIKGLEGMKVEMRVPYRAMEVRFLPHAPFPPVAREEVGVLVVEMGDDVRRAIEAAVRFRLADRLTCAGNLTGPAANEAVLQRYEDERRAPSDMLPFLAEADLDGDKRPDLYVRLEGMPETVVFNTERGLKAVTARRETVDALPRCDASPVRFARPVPGRKVKCMGDVKHAGDAIERVHHNRSSELLMWDGSRLVTCEPLGEGAMPPAPKPKKPPKKSDDDEW